MASADLTMKPVIAFWVAFVTLVERISRLARRSAAARVRGIGAFLI
jgi:hypothetical protein